MGITYLQSVHLLTLAALLHPALLQACMALMTTSGLHHGALLLRLACVLATTSPLVIDITMILCGVACWCRVSAIGSNSITLERPLAYDIDPLWQVWWRKSFAATCASPVWHS